MLSSEQDSQLLVPVPWETRNLGRMSYALDERALAMLLTDATILMEVIKNQEAIDGAIFIQTRADQKYAALFPALQACGFYFTEMTLHPYTNLNANAVLQYFIEAPEAFVPSHCRLEELSITQMDKRNPAEVTQVKAIANETFTDSRFHYDALCPVEIANGRYVFWVDDMLAIPSVCFDLIWMKNRVVGFMARQDSELLLTGLAQSHIGMGLGRFLWLSSMKILKAAGATEVHTTISAFNSAVHNLYVRLAFKFRDPMATFHYWTPR